MKKCIRIKVFAFIEMPGLQREKILDRYKCVENGKGIKLIFMPFFLIHDFSYIFCRGLEGYLTLCKYAPAEYQSERS